MIAMKEKQRRPVYFALAAGMHALFLFGHFAFFHPAEYGLQGSAASMEVYMVAALPKTANKPVVMPKERASVQIESVKVQGEMPVPQQKKTADKSSNEKAKNTQEKSTGKQEAVGDGSSKEPGKSKTTFYSMGSDEITAKPGKYQNPSPTYPKLALERRQEGVVYLRLNVRKDGRVSNVTLEKSCGYSMLDRSALQTIKRWRFESARIAGKAVESTLTLPVRFAIEDVK